MFYLIHIKINIYNSPQTVNYLNGAGDPGGAAILRKEIFVKGLRNTFTKRTFITVIFAIPTAYCVKYGVMYFFTNPRTLSDTSLFIYICIITLFRIFIKYVIDDIYPNKYLKKIKYKN